MYTQRLVLTQSSQSLSSRFDVKMKPASTLLKFYRWYVGRPVFAWLAFALFMFAALGPDAIRDIRLGESLFRVLATSGFLFVFGIGFFYYFFKYALWRQLRLSGYTELRLRGGDE